MKEAWGRDRLAAALGRVPRAPAVAIGSFDGVHLGHQALVTAARARAAAQPGGDGSVGVLTFDPHPARFFAPDLAPPLIVPLARRLELLGEAGADFALVERFDAALAAMSPAAFVDEVLVGALHVGHVVVGYDFSFGHKRAGTVATLAELGVARGFSVSVIAPVSVDGITCSSTKIREFLLEGKVEGARRLLGRSAEITGEVVRGAGRGRGLGIPTANLAPEGDLSLRTGIYAGRAVLLDRGGARYPAAISVGTNPTFLAAGAPAVTVEAYLLDYPGDDIYGTRVRLFFEARLRDERRFASVDELLAEIARDVERTREILR